MDAKEVTVDHDESEEEEEVNLEAELINALKQLRKERKKIKLLEKEPSQVKENTQDITTPREMRKAFMDLRAKLEEAKVTEESLREQLEEKEETQEELEREIVSLRRNLEKENIKKKYDKSTKTLYQNINNQRPIDDKSGLGYCNEDEKYKIGTWNSKKHETSTSFSKDESEATRHEHVQRKETMRRTKQEGHQEVGPTPQERLGNKKSA